MAGPSLHNTQCSSPTLYTHTVHIELDGRRHVGRQAARGREGARENGGWEGCREQGAEGREDVMM